MTVTEFKIWLVENNHTQASLAKVLGMSTRTIGNYVASGHFPPVFVLALRHLSHQKSSE